MRISLTSVFVDDQRAALAFYTDVLGFTKRRDIPARRRFLAYGRVTRIARRPGTPAGAVAPPGGEAVPGCTC